MFEARFFVVVVPRLINTRTPHRKTPCYACTAFSLPFRSIQVDICKSATQKSYATSARASVFLPLAEFVCDLFFFFSATINVPRCEEENEFFHLAWQFAFGRRLLNPRPVLHHSSTGVNVRAAVYTFCINPSLFLHSVCALCLCARISCNQFEWFKA